jgi:hypothetical protein
MNNNYKINNKVIQFLLLLLIFACISCVQHKDKSPTNSERLKQEISKLDLNAPKNDLNINIKKGDLRFMCVCGYGCYSPGLKRDDIPLETKYGQNCIEGTSDVIESDEHESLINTATEYAERYNAELLKKLKLESRP